MLTKEMGCELHAEFRKDNLLSLKETEADQTSTAREAKDADESQPANIPFYTVKKGH